MNTLNTNTNDKLLPTYGEIVHGQIYENMVEIEDANYEHNQVKYNINYYGNVLYQGVWNKFTNSNVTDLWMHEKYCKPLTEQNCLEAFREYAERNFRYSAIDSYYATGTYPEGDKYYERSEDIDELIKRKKEFSDWKIFVTYNNGTDKRINPSLHKTMRDSAKRV